MMQDNDGVRRSASETQDGSGVTSDALWDTLHSACMHMQRIDLGRLCDERNLDGKWHRGIIAISADGVCRFHACVLAGIVIKSKSTFNLNA
jgi:hypothetical protein